MTDLCMRITTLYLDENREKIHEALSTARRLREELDRTCSASDLLCYGQVRLARDRARQLVDKLSRLENTLVQCAEDTEETEHRVRGILEQAAEDNSGTVRNLLPD